MQKFYQLNLKHVLMFFILLLALTATQFAQTPQYYNYNIIEGTNYFPFGVTGGKECQWLYGPGNFNQPSSAPSGNITKVYFFMGFTNGNATLTDLTIKMGQTTLTDLPAGVIYTGQLDTVYFRASVNLVSTIGQWMMFTLDRPFSYDNTKSLIIDVSQCGATNTSVVVCQHAYGGQKRCYINGTTSCVFTYSGQDGNAANSGIDVAPVSCNYAWTSQTSGTTQLLQAVSAVSDMVGWAAGGAANIRRTTNGGTTWTDANPNPGVVNGAVYNMFAIDANTCLLTTSPAATYIYRTSNAGVNWTQVFTQAGGFIDAIAFTNATTGFAYGDPVGSRWSLWKTTNGGINWDSTGLYLPQNAAEAGWNNAMKIIGTNIWFGTNGTRVYHSTNFGTSWTFGATTGDVNSYCLQFNSLTTGMSGGAGLSYTTNGGANYSALTGVPGTGNVTSMSGGISGGFWFSRGNNVYMTTNNGANFSTAFTGTAALWGMDFAMVNGCPTGWAVGAGGVILHMALVTGISNNHNQVPTSYTLMQNYPNPFNPTTKISYQIPNTGMVKLAIFDMLGREVGTLVNEVKQAGTYNVEFNASNLASGVYFYKLEAGSFVDTKKMILVK